MALGDKRSRAITLGDIARVLAAKGDVDQALKLHQENLAIAEALGDLDGIAKLSGPSPQIEMRQQHFKQAFEHLAVSYDINLKVGRWMQSVTLARILANFFVPEVILRRA
jgi:hypothetical protein